MGRRLFFAVVTATMALTLPACVLAAGAPIRKPPVIVPEVAAAPAPSASSPPSVGISHEQIFGGCGRGRVRDPRTNQCRGPADVGR